jgi:hypothetical protein
MAAPTTMTSPTRHRIVMTSERLVFTMVEETKLWPA